jgi:hypothetical protein
MMGLQANIMKSAYNTAKRYYKIAAKDDLTWQSLYAPVMAQYAAEAYQLPVRPQDTAFFRSRNMLAHTKMQQAWYDARLQTNRYAYGLREHIDYEADIMVRQTRSTSAFLGISMAEAYYETYREQRRIFRAKAITLGKRIQSEATQAMAQAVEMKTEAAHESARAVDGIGAAVTTTVTEAQVDAQKANSARELGYTKYDTRRPVDVLKAAVGLGEKRNAVLKTLDKPVTSNMSNSATSVTGAGGAYSLGS